MVSSSCDTRQHFSAPPVRRRPRASALGGSRAREMACVRLRHKPGEFGPGEPFTTQDRNRGRRAAYTAAGKEDLWLC